MGGHGNFGRWDHVGEGGSLGVELLRYSILDHPPPRFLLPVHNEVHHCPLEHTPVAIFCLSAWSQAANLLKLWASLSYSSFKVFLSGIWSQK